MKYFVTLALILSFFTLQVSAQKSADGYFSQGQSKQKELTKKSQEAAIELYKKAKASYSSKENKDKCDKQIAICRATIKQISDHKSNPNPSKPKSEKDKDKAVIKNSTSTSETSSMPIQISLSKSSLEFKSKKDNETIEVTCNSDDWSVKSSASWITTTRNGKELTIMVDENSENDIRTGKVTVSCRKATAELLVTQKPKKTLKGFIKGVKESVVGK